MPFPEPPEETALHDRLVSGDPLAPVDVAKALLEPLAAAMEHDLRCDQEIAHDGTIDALIFYFESASLYQPKRGRLATYLLDIAKKRCIDRIRSSSRQAVREVEFGVAVELRAPAPKEVMETHVEATRLWQKVEAALPGERDRAAMRLILDGERSTAELALALGLPSSLSDRERQAEVKRHRDRLTKVLARIGEKVR